MIVNNRISPLQSVGTEPPARDAPDAKVVGWGKALVERAGNALGKYPAATLGTALSIGVLLGWLIKRH